MASRLIVKATEEVAGVLTGVVYSNLGETWPLVKEISLVFSTYFINEYDEYAAVDDTPAARALIADGSLILLGEIEL